MHFSEFMSALLTYLVYLIIEEMFTLFVYLSYQFTVAYYYL